MCQRLYGNGSSCDTIRASLCYSSTTSNSAYSSRRFCQCANGYADEGPLEAESMDGCLTNNETCIDVDECTPSRYANNSNLVVANDCDPLSQCVNTQGSFLCLCAAGSTQPDEWSGAPGVSCSQCPPGRYKSQIGPRECDICPMNSNTSAGAQNLTACRCIAGYTGQDGANCSACVPGSYKQLLGDDACQLCPAAKYSTAAASTECLSCPSNSTSLLGSNQLTDCTCLSGYTGDSGQVCVACPTGTFKAVNGSRACERCEAGSYSEQAGSTVCTSCTKNSVGPIGSTSRLECLCEPGFTPNTTSPQTLICLPCEAGTFKAIDGTSVCEKCRPGSYSSAQKSVKCFLCSPGTYNPDFSGNSVSACLACPAEGGTSSFPGSVAKADCALDPEDLDLLTSSECGSLNKLPSGSFPTRNGHSMARVEDRIYLFGGLFQGARNDIWFYEIASAAWTEISLGSGDARPQARTDHTMVEIDGDLLVFGGRNGKSLWNDVWKFTTRDDEWFEIFFDGNPSPVARFSHSAVATSNSMYIFGGEGEDGLKRNDLWKWVSSGWQQLSPSLVPSPRAGHRMVRSGSSLFVFGGRDASNSPLNDLWAYAYATATWQKKETALQPPARYLHAMIGLGPILVLHGGATASGRLNDLWQYDSVQERWIEVFGDSSSGIRRRQLHQMVDFQGKIMIHGGAADVLVGSEVQQYIVRDAWVFVPCICLLPGTTSIAGTYQCASCSVATYKDWYGPGNCLGCPLNATGPAGSVSKTNCICVGGFHGDNGGECAACPAGKYNLNGSQPCQPCPAGTSNLATASNTCTLCPAGTFSEQDMGGGRAACIPCQSNSTSSVGSKIVTDCKCIPGYTGQTQCTPCSPGTYKIAQGPAACSVCLAGSFSTVEGASRPSCEMCPSFTGSDDGARHCECLAGFYPISEQGRVCAPCPPGTFKGARGDVHCTGTCLQYETSLPGASSRYDCFCFKGYSREKGTGNCTECPAGTFKSLDGDSACNPCVEGTYSSAVAATVCLYCPDANAASGEGSDQLTDCVCKPGYFLGQDSACTACVPGTFKNTSGPELCSLCSMGSYSRQSAQTSCILCQSNSTAQEGSNRSEDCLCFPGYFAANGHTCLPCPAGTFKAISGSAPCAECERGKYAGAASLLCSECPADSTTPYSRSTSALDCKHCKRGYTGAFGSCSPCQPGSYKNVTGSSPCLKCAPGSYQNAQAAHNCTLCQSGSFLGGFGAIFESNCSACPAGKTSKQGVSDLSNCTCTQGYSGPDGEAVCVACTNGTFKSEMGSGACIACEAGTYQEMVASSACTLCPSGKYLPVEGSKSLASCRDCPANTNTSAGSPLVETCLCNPGYGVTMDERCEACLPGTFKSSNAKDSCSDCPAGSFTDANSIASTVCSLCIAGTFSSRVGASSPDVCTACVNFSSSPEGSLACKCNEGYTGPSENVQQPGYYCTACAPGVYKDFVGDEACSPCAIGKFADFFGATACLPCPQFSSTAGNGTSRETDCECLAGYTGQSASHTPCTPCQPGKYKAIVGTSECELCGVAKYSSVQAGASESVCRSCPDYASWSPYGSATSQDCVCASGYFLPAGAMLCAACQEGKYKPTYGDNASCIECPSHSTTIGIRSTSLQNCLCQAGFTGEPSNLEACSPCEAGYYKHILGTARCRACDFAKYLGTVGATSEDECQSCPDPNQWSRNGSRSVLACMCAAGYTRIDYATSCSTCFSGSHKPNPGDMACTQCDSGTYSSVAAESCKTCPVASDSPARSGLVTDCVCNEGYTGKDGGQCLPCAPGAFKSINGSLACILCGVGKYLPSSASVKETQCLACPNNTNAQVGSIAIENCLCDPGFTGSGASECLMCPAGKYKPLGGSSSCTECSVAKYSGSVGATSEATCIECPADSFSHVASAAFEDCACNAGFALTDILCTRCARGSYKATNGSDACTLCVPGKFLSDTGARSEVECFKCPTDSMSPAGSHTVADCVCSAGYTGDPESTGTGGDALNQACLACSTGKYKAIAGTSVCLPCPTGTYVNVTGLAECQACPQHSNSGTNSQSIAACICNAGFFGSSGACSACPPGTFKESNGPTACSKCGAGTYSNATGATASSICVACATGAQAKEGSATIADCNCNAGFTGTGRSCDACDSGKYKPGDGSAPCDLCPDATYSETRGAANVASCLRCPVHANSFPGSISPLNCTCNMGYSGPNGQQCLACAQGKYKDWHGLGACADCPLHTLSAAAADSNYACVCNSGYTGANGSACQACLPGSFKVIPGPWRCLLCAGGTYSLTPGGTAVDTCIACPSNEVSSSGASLLANCTCNVGRERSNGNCQACPVAKYKRSSGEEPCEDCPAGRTSAPGGTDVLDCVCDLGYSGSACGACPKGTYKDQVGTSVCLECATGKFSTTVASISNAACNMCPQHMSSLAASSSKHNCSCNPGFVTSTAGACQVCAPGSFSTDGAAETCTTCAGGAYSLEGSTQADDCLVYSFSIQARILLNGMGNSQDFLAKRTLFITSFPGNLASSDDLTIIKVCDNAECVEIVKSGYATLSGPTATAGQVEVEFEVRTKQSSATDLAAALSASVTLRTFENTFFAGDNSKSVSYSVAPASVPSSQLSETCGRWYELNVLGQMRSGHCLAQAHGRVFAFGGSGGFSFRNDLRQFDVLARKWVTMITDQSSMGPTARINARLVASSDALFLFGGWGVDGNVLGDMWMLNLRAWTWKEVSQSSPWPSVRHSHAVASDGQGTFFMFGGLTSSAVINDLWRWESSGSKWLELRVDGNTDGPSGREAHALALVGSELFLFGGRDITRRNTNELWKYSVAHKTWELIFANSNSNGPSPRHRHAMESVNGSLLLFGGQALNNYALNDIWAFQPGEMSWSQLQDNGNLRGPRPRYLFGMVSLGSTLIIDGGLSPGIPAFQDTWQYSVCRCPVGSQRLGGVCILCPAGTFKNLPGPQMCTQCPSVTFGVIIGATDDTVCQDCPAHSWSSPGSVMASNCACREGYSPEGPVCVACVAGMFKESNGSAPCVACAKGSYASSNASFSCVLCAAGKYGAELETLRTNETSCVACPHNSSSQVGTSEPSGCLCERGYTGRNGAACTACLPGYYKDENGESNCSQCQTGKYSGVPARESGCILCTSGKYSNATAATQESTCKSCPLLSDSAAGASGLDACLCDAGTTGTHGACVACVAGKYKSINGSSICIDCPSGSWSGNERSSSCEGCEAGKYSTVSSSTSDVCLDCPENTISDQGSGSIAECHCNMGYTGSNGVCASCSPGTFKDSAGPEVCTHCPASTFSRHSGATNSSTCQQCPARSESMPGTSSLVNCTCVAGSEGSALGGCGLCLAGKYKSSGSGNCTACPFGSWNHEGSENVTQCTCSKGYAGVDGEACHKCEAGTYKSSNGSGSCTDCLAGKYSTQVGGVTESVCLDCALDASSQSASNTPAFCLCNAGYEGDGSSSCVACVPGKYKALDGAMACSNCVADSSSPPQSTHASECVCNKGFTSDSPSTCIACVAGTFKPANGSGSCTACVPGKYGENTSAFEEWLACEDCPAETFSSNASPSLLSCVCNRGFTGTNGAVCSACPSGTYKPTDGSSVCTLCSEGKFGEKLSAVLESACESCTANAHSAAGSTTRAACHCVRGFSRTNWTEICSECLRGTYKSVFGDVACTDCPQNTYGGQQAAVSVSVCTSCPTNSLSEAGSDELSDCVCSPGYTFTQASKGCTKCPRGTYKSVDGNQECTLCPADTYLQSTGATSQSTCTNCPQFTSSAPGSEGSWQCLCKKGYTGELSQCIACPPGTYKPTLGKDPCTQCNIGKYSGSASATSESACLECSQGTTTLFKGSTQKSLCDCVRGTFGGGGEVACYPCEAGSYKELPGPGNCTLCAIGKQSALEGQISETTCQECPQHSNTTGPKSASLAQCLCDYGYTGDEMIGMRCAACPIGTYKADTGTSDCLPCRPGTYQDEIASSTCDLCVAGTYRTKYGSNSSQDCTSCPESTQSHAGSSSRVSCVCNAGYSGPDGGLCAACPKSYFKAQNGSAACQECYPGTWDNRMASTACVLCTVGTYSTAFGAISNTTCTDCPVNTISDPASGSVLDCVCSPGYTGFDGGTSYNCTPCDAGYEKQRRGNGTCSPCALGTYAAQIASLSCSQCPQFSSTVSSRSALREDCLCEAGYTGDISRNTGCASCKAGTFKMIMGPSECVDCGHGKFSSAVAANNETLCLDCPDSNHWSSLGSTDVLECKCDRGYSLSENTEVCTPCVAGTFKDAPGDDVCTGCGAGTYSSGVASITIDTCLLCAANSVSLARSASSTDCICKMGFEGSGDGTCSSCPPGKFKNAVGDGPCGECHAGSYSNSTNSTACYLCQDDTYSAVIGAQSEATCQDCPSQQTSDVGSDTRTDCRCIPGYTGQNGAPCSACGLGSFKSSTGNATCDACAQASYIGMTAATVCLDCPANYDTVNPGSTSLDQCVCDFGYFKEGAGCRECLQGQYKDFIGDSTCQQCATFSNSKPASVVVEDCVCNEGYSGPDGGVCASCEAGTFKPTNGSHPCSLCGMGKYSSATAALEESQCTLCPTNTTSVPGSTSLSNCSCNAGFTGPGGRCSACEPGTFKPISGSAVCVNCAGGKYSGAIAASSESVCTQCPSSSFAQPGSGAQDDCSCNVGYTGPGGQCGACVIGKYKATNGSDDCIMCGVAKYLGKEAAIFESECIKCPSNSTSMLASSNISSCLCEPGFTGSPANYTKCSQCPLGSYKNIQGSSACVWCESGKYADVSGLSECVSCPDNSSSVIGTMSLVGCICNRGYTGSLGACSACRMGTFKNKTGPANCTLCDAGTYSNATAQSSITACKLCPLNTFSLDSGTPNLLDCSCNPGYSGNNTICTACQLGTYKAVYGGSKCVACAAGKYAQTTALAECTMCPNNTFSTLAGSKLLSDCICNAGFTQNRIVTCDAPLDLTTTSCRNITSCTSCLPGTYKSSSGPLPCSTCTRGTYLSSFAAVSQTQCLDCPQNSRSPRGSVAMSQCVCDAGFSGRSGNCSMCKPGTFKAVDGPADCTLCAAGKYSSAAASTTDCQMCPSRSTSVQGSSHISDCQCVAGFTGTPPNCYDCQKGSYKNMAGNMACTACPTGSSSPLASDDVGDCACVVGLFDSNSGASVTCIACPVNHTSRAGSSDVSECFCKPGYTGPGAGVCTACHIGNFKSAAGSGACSECAVGTFSNAAGMSQCSTCPAETITVGAASGAISDCLCKPGRTNFFGPDGQACSLCPINTYKKDLGSNNCTLCPYPSRSVAGSSKFDDCQCEVGGDCFFCPIGSYRAWYGSVTACIACDPGTYSSTLGATDPSTCLECPLFSKSDAGAPGLMNCSCNIGYGGSFVNGDLYCLKCAIGSYKNWEGSDACAACPAQSSTLGRKSDTVDDCLCNAGHTRRSESCHACERGKYKTIPGSSACFDCDRGKYGLSYGAISGQVCTQCPIASVSRPGSLDVFNCSCNMGYTGDNGGPCIACPRDTFKELIGPSPCISCPSNAVSNTSSPRQLDCMCDYGYYGQDGTVCTVCERGKYKDVIGHINCSMCGEAKYSPQVGQISESACLDCPANATSDPGRWQVKQCLCKPGFWGTNGSICTACHQVTYKTPRGEAPLGLISDCNACPSFSWSPFASPYCRCNVGYEGPDQGEYRGAACALCVPGKYKNWRGSGECETCHERIKPRSRSFWVSPADPVRACDWHCESGYYYPDQKYLHSDELSFTRPVEMLEPAWFSWYELDQYKAVAPFEYYADIRRYLPNSCELCTVAPPAANPCGYGEYWSDSHCSSAENNGCKLCTNTIGESVRYVLPNPFWRLADCPTTCAVGHFDGRSDEVIRAPSTAMYPLTCVACPPPLSRLDGTGEFLAPTCFGTDIYMQCGVGMGNMGVDTPPFIFTKVFNWNGACQSGSV